MCLQGLAAGQNTRGPTLQCSGVSTAQQPLDQSAGPYKATTPPAFSQPEDPGGVPRYPL